MVLAAVLNLAALAQAGEQASGTTTEAAETATASPTAEGSSGDAEAGAGFTAGQDAEISYSEAEKILWLADHLKSIDKPSRLNYVFEKSGTLEEGFTDSVQLDILEVLPDGMKKANVNFFTGDRYHYVPPYDAISGNPLLAVYLHGDVLEMNRLTEGHWRYFQRRIKFAFSEAAEITSVTFEFNGKTVQGKQVKITPYATDPKREKNEKYEKVADKTYIITMSEEVPGGLYRIQAVVPPPKDAADRNLVVEESMTLVSVEDLPASSETAQTTP